MTEFNGQEQGIALGVHYDPQHKDEENATYTCCRRNKIALRTTTVLEETTCKACRREQLRLEALPNKERAVHSYNA